MEKGFTFWKLKRGNGEMEKGNGEMGTGGKWGNGDVTRGGERRREEGRGGERRQRKRCGGEGYFGGAMWEKRGAVELGEKKRGNLKLLFN